MAPNIPCSFAAILHFIRELVQESNKICEIAELKKLHESSRRCAVGNRSKSLSRVLRRVSVHRKEDEIFEIGGSVSVAQIEGHPIQLQLSLL